MRFFAVFPIAFMLLFAMPVASFCQDWQAVTDELEVDYAKGIVRVFALAKAANSDSMLTAARTPLFTYLGTLTAGPERTPLAQIFKTRPVIYAKMQQVVTQQMRGEGSVFLPDLQKYSQYYIFDLNLLKSVLPDINMPQPGGAVQ